MATETRNAGNIPDAEELTATLGRIAEQSQDLVTDFIARQTADAGKIDAEFNDPLNIVPAFHQMAQRMMAEPARVAKAQVGLWNNYMELWGLSFNEVHNQNDPQTPQTPNPDSCRIFDFMHRELAFAFPAFYKNLLVRPHTFFHGGPSRPLRSASASI